MLEQPVVRITRGECIILLFVLIVGFFREAILSCLLHNLIYKIAHIRTLWAVMTRAHTIVLRSGTTIYTVIGY